jgi:hypothetical protein
MVLAIICHPQPEEGAQRDQMLSTLRRQTDKGKVRQGVLSTEEYLSGQCQRKF